MKNHPLVSGWLNPVDSSNVSKAVNVALHEAAKTGSKFGITVQLSQNAGIVEHEH